MPFVRSATAFDAAATAEGSAETILRYPAAPTDAAHDGAVATGAGRAEAGARAPGGRSLFAATARPAVVADSPVAAGELTQPRSSLFGIVTGAIRRTLPSSGTASEQSGLRTEPSLDDIRPEHVRMQVRPAAQADEMGLDIPAFLRRQSS
jgi:cell division protein FtsZ